MRSGLSPLRAMSLWRRRKASSKDSSGGRQSAVCMTLHKVNLVNYVCSVPVVRTAWQVGPSAVFENQGEFGACGYPLAGEPAVFWAHPALLQGGGAGLV